MPDRTIIFAQNGRHGVRGLSALNPSEFEAYHEDDDALTYIFDFASYLGSDTISSVTRTPSGPTISNEANTTTQMTQRIAGTGHVDFKATFAGGDKEEFRVFYRPRVSTSAEVTQAAEVPDPMAQTYTSTSDPTRDDDTGDGHWVGRFWLNTATGNLFFCKTNAAGAAIWSHLQRTWTSTGASTTLTGTTSETVLATLSLPGGIAGINGVFEIRNTWDVNNDASGKTGSLRLGVQGAGVGGTQLRANSLATTVGAMEGLAFKNNNSQSVQQSFNTLSGSSASAWGGGGAAATTAAIDTANAFDIIWTGTLADSADNLTLKGWIVTLSRPDIT